MKTVVLAPLLFLTTTNLAYRYSNDVVTEVADVPELTTESTRDQGNECGTGECGGNCGGSNRECGADSGCGGNDSGCGGQEAAAASSETSCGGGCGVECGAKSQNAESSDCGGNCGGGCGNKVPEKQEVETSCGGDCGGECGKAQESSDCGGNCGGGCKSEEKTQENSSDCRGDSSSDCGSNGCEGGNCQNSNKVETSTELVAEAMAAVAAWRKSQRNEENCGGGGSCGQQQSSCNSNGDNSSSECESCGNCPPATVERLKLLSFCFLIPVKQRCGSVCQLKKAVKKQCKQARNKSKCIKKVKCQQKPKTCTPQKPRCGPVCKLKKKVKNKCENTPLNNQRACVKNVKKCGEKSCGRPELIDNTPKMNPCEMSASCQKMQAQFEAQVQVETGGFQSQSMTIHRRTRVKSGSKYSVRWTGGSDTGFVYVSGVKVEHRF